MTSPVKKQLIGKLTAPGQKPQDVRFVADERAVLTKAEQNAGLEWVNADYEPGDVRRYGAKGDGTTDDSQAFTDALASNEIVRVPDGTWMVQGLSTTSRQLVYGDSKQAILKKNANGTLLTMGVLSIIRDLKIDGDGANYTGSNIVISAGDNTTDPDDYGFQIIENCEIYESASYCIEYDTANRGVLSKVQNCLLDTYNNNNACIKWPDEPTTFGNRVIDKCETVGSDLVDVGAADNGMITNCTVGGTNGILFPSGQTNTASKLIITNNRLAQSGDLDIRGINHVIAHNSSARNIELLSGCENVTLGPNNFAASVGHVDSSGDENYIYDSLRSSFTPTFSGDGGSEAFGNASVRGEWWREGEWVVYKLYVSWGSTSNFGGANWTFTLPRNPTSGVTTWYSGSAFLNNQPGVATVDTNNDLVYLYHANTTGRVGATAPFTWSSGNVLAFEVKYRI